MSIAMSLHNLHHQHHSRRSPSSTPSDSPAPSLAISIGAALASNPLLHALSSPASHSTPSSTLTSSSSIADSSFPSTTIGSSAHLQQRQLQQPLPSSQPLSSAPSSVSQSQSQSHPPSPPQQLSRSTVQDAADKAATSLPESTPRPPSRVLLLSQTSTPTASDTAAAAQVSRTTTAPELSPRLLAQSTMAQDQEHHHSRPQESSKQYHSHHSQNQKLAPPPQSTPDYVYSGPAYRLPLGEPTSTATTPTTSIAASAMTASSLATAQAEQQPKLQSQSQSGGRLPVRIGLDDPRIAQYLPQGALSLRRNTFPSVVVPPTIADSSLSLPDTPENSQAGHAVSGRSFSQGSVFATGPHTAGPLSSLVTSTSSSSSSPSTFGWSQSSARAPFSTTPSTPLILPPFSTLDRPTGPSRILHSSSATPSSSSSTSSSLHNPLFRVDSSAATAGQHPRQPLVSWPRGNVVRNPVSAVHQVQRKSQPKRPTLAVEAPLPSEYADRHESSSSSPLPSPSPSPVTMGVEKWAHAQSQQITRADLPHPPHHQGPASSAGAAPRPGGSLPSFTEFQKPLRLDIGLRLQDHEAVDIMDHDVADSERVRSISPPFSSSAQTSQVHGRRHRNMTPMRSPGPRLAPVGSEMASWSAMNPAPPTAHGPHEEVCARFKMDYYDVYKQSPKLLRPEGGREDEKLFLASGRAELPRAPEAVPAHFSPIFGSQPYHTSSGYLRPTTGTTALPRNGQYRSPSVEGWPLVEAADPRHAPYKGKRPAKPRVSSTTAATTAGAAPSTMTRRKSVSLLSTATTRVLRNEDPKPLIESSVLLNSHHDGQHSQGTKRNRLTNDENDSQHSTIPRDSGRSSFSMKIDNLLSPAESDEESDQTVSHGVIRGHQAIMDFSDYQDQQSSEPPKKRKKSVLVKAEPSTTGASSATTTTASPSVNDDGQVIAPTPKKRLSKKQRLAAQGLLTDSAADRKAARKAKKLAMAGNVDEEDALRPISAQGFRHGGERVVQEPDELVVLDPDVGPVGLLNTKNAPRVIWKGTPLPITGKPGADILHPHEEHIASTLRLSPAQYLSCKKTLIMASREYAADPEGKQFRKSDAQKLCRIDVNKTSRLWEVFAKIGWLENISAKDI